LPEGRVHRVILGERRRQGRIRGGAWVRLFVVAVLVAALAGAVQAGDIEGHWAEQYLAEGGGHGIVRGYTDGTVRPDAPVTRAEFATMACRATGEEENAAVAARLLPVFADVPSDHWALGYFRLSHEMGLVQGDQDSLAHPDDPITRAELAVIAARLVIHLRLQSLGGSSASFADQADIPSWAAPAVASLAGQGVLKGDDRGLFRPGDTTTRAEAVVVLLRVLEMQGSRWDLTGEVRTVNAETGLMHLILGSEDVAVKCDQTTLLFKNGVRVFLGQVEPGAAVRVLFRKGKPGFASVASIR